MLTWWLQSGGLTAWCWLVHPALGLLSLYLVWVSHRLSAWVWAVGSLWFLVSPGRRPWVTLASGLGLAVPIASMKIATRWQTYRIVFVETWRHPWVGHGHDAFAVAGLVHQLGLPLPSLHSQWLSVAYHDGWPAVVALAGMVWVIWKRVPLNWVGKGTRAVLLSAAGSGLIQEWWIIRGLSTYLMVCAAGWLWSTQQEGVNES